MFDQKRIHTLLKRVALAGASLLLVVLSVSGARASETRAGLSVQVIRQAIGLRAPTLRRPTNVQTRSAKIEHSDYGAERSSTDSFASTSALCLHQWNDWFPKATYRVISSEQSHEAAILRGSFSIEVRRARAPPKIRAAAALKP